MGALLKKIDDGLYLVERWISVVASVAMAIVVFLALVHRSYSAMNSKLVEKIGKWTGMDQEGSTYLALQDASTYLLWVIAFGLIFFGLRSASSRPLLADVPKPPEDQDPPMPAGKAAIMTVGALAGIWLGLRLLFGSGNPEEIIACEDAFTWTCGMYPNGLTWAQPLALIFTLWLGFLGASMATHDHRHLKVEALQRYLPEKAQHIAGFVSALVAAGFCIFLALLAYRYVGYKYEDYIDAGMLGGFHDGIDVPRYKTFIIVPIAYVIMAGRFVASGVLSLRGELDTTPAELADLGLEDLEAENTAPGLNEEPEPDPGPPDDPGDSTGSSDEGPADAGAAKEDGQ